MSNELIFETKSLCKNFGPTVALNKVDLRIHRGFITGLIGENGSGKSTISSIAAGMQPATSGQMFFMGEPHKPMTMIEGAKSGIGMIVQEQGTISGLTIAQNIFLGHENDFLTHGYINKKKMNEEAKRILEIVKFGRVDPSMLIDRLDMQDRKLIEIAKVVHNQPELLIVDETTTALSQFGREIIYEIMRNMRDQNKAVIFISHDLDELMETCDTLTVLRDGILIDTLDREHMTPDNIKRLMVGREMKGQYYRDDYDEIKPSPTILKVDNVTTASGMLMNFSMEVQEAEILGIGGLSDCGMHELGKAILGDEGLLNGEIRHVPTNQIIKNAMQAVGLGMGYVSKDRDREALVLTASIEDNILSAGLDKITNPLGVIVKKRKKAFVNKQVEDLYIKCASTEQQVQYLSGGNKQKVVFGKWVGRDCDVLILDCPTRGVDIGVKAAMYQLIYQMKLAGKTIIMISEELQELIGMSDRILVIKDGKLNGQFLRSRNLSEHMVIDKMI